MGNIQVLSFEVANLIAAGEVVDRPASAIKEMMENAIDAGATHITVEIQNGGVTFMRVTDDGCGMSAEDLPMAIRRHATSKIRDAEDLDGILTLGFRGEALAAISSVSDMRIMSKRREDDMGSMLEVKGGQLLGVTERGCRDGTTVIVENLFTNVPARRKFLKRDATESMAVAANVERVALSHPEIAVRLITDGVTKLETAGDGQLKSAIWAVFGKDFATRLIPLDSEHEGIRITGFIGRSDNVKSNRNGQNFFINNRFVRSRTAQAALEQAFVSYIPPEKYPCCVMNIGLNPARVDVNVHPAKLEVKFSNEKPVFEAVYYAVRQALEQNITRPEFAAPEKKPLIPGGGRASDATRPIEIERPESLGKRQVSMEMAIPAKPAPTVDMTPKETVHPPQERITAEDYINYYVNRRRQGGDTKADQKGSTHPIEQIAKSAPPVDSIPSAPIQPVMPSQPPMEEIPLDVYEAEAKAMFGDVPPPIEEIASPVPAENASPAIPAEMPAEAPRPHAPIPTDFPVTTKENQPQATQDPYRMVGEVFHSYVIVEQGDRMLLIDKHAAHERINFEQLKANMKDKAVDAQLLMLPIEIMLMSEEVGLLDSYRQELEAVGFSYTCLRNTVRVDSIPSGIEAGAVPDMLAAIAEQLKSGVDTAKLTRDILFEKALYQASCKAAIKAGRDYPPEHIAWLVDKLMEIPDITFCPHGRPVAMEMKKRNIDHQFERC
ncbi:MAG: DNA mismatch repair endonuclease MutL [Clostridia bacterium]|nr:DNA mismatch repair endonuclease MutL [Clostridia bacterium]